jgi:shikimate kinase
MATGGGAFMNEKTRDLIECRAISVWLRADLDLLVRRTSRRSHRPLLRGRDHREVLGKLMEERHPVYAKADVVVDSADGPPDAMAEQVARAIMDYVRRSGIDGPEDVVDDGCILPESDKEVTW